MNRQVAEVSCRIRELRDILELSVEEVSNLTGIPIGTYLQYENAEADIPISAIYSIAAAMEIDPTVLLSGEGPRMDTYTVVRDGQGMKVERYKEYAFASLAYNFKNREMEPMIVTLLPQQKPPELVQHGGQEFNYVLEGRIVVLYGDRRIQLDQGDSIYFDPSVKHGQMALDGPAKFLTVINE